MRTASSFSCGSFHVSDELQTSHIGIASLVFAGDRLLQICVIHFASGCERKGRENLHNTLYCGHLVAKLI